jgi:tetratricopeptide (TPR) repeat protein
MPLSSNCSVRLLSRRATWIPALSVPLVLLLLLASAPARADDAKTHYQKATAHFAIGEYHDAAIEYEEAFKLKQDPAILFNAAQSFRLAGDNQKALLLYNNIIKLYPGTQYARDSRERIEKLAQSGTSPPAAVPPPAAAPATAPPPVTPIPTPVAATAPPPAINPALPPGTSAMVVSSPPPSGSEDKPVYTRWWFWAGAGAVTVGAVIAVVALSSRGSAGPWNNIDNVQGLVPR